MKVFGYIRVSGKSQIKGDGFRRQTANINQFIFGHNQISTEKLELEKIFEERGVTGECDLAGRKAWNDCLTACAAMNINTVLVDGLDRFSRNLVVQERAVADLRELGINLVGTGGQRLSTVDPVEVMTRQIFGSVAQYEKALIVKKLAVARMTKKAKTGRCEGAFEYGHKLIATDGTQIDYRPGETDTLNKMIELTAAGQSAAAICKYLNDSGVPSRRGGIWHPMVILRILRRSRRRNSK